MAAKNGPIITLVYFVAFIIIMCAVLILVTVWISGSMSSVLIEPNHAHQVYVTNYHDHRLSGVESWENTTRN
jgi:hypothetical protein